MERPDLDLKPCPFCGSADVSLESPAEGYESRDVKCRNCLATGPGVICDWNDRHLESGAPALLTLEFGSGRISIEHGTQRDSGTPVLCLKDTGVIVPERQGQYGADKTGEVAAPDNTDVVLVFPTPESMRVLLEELAKVHPAPEVPHA